MPREQVVEVLLRDRSCGSDWMIIQANDLAQLAMELNSLNLLVFAAMEARNAIEQLWFDILLILHRGEVTLDFVDSVRRRRDGFLAAIRDEEPNYRKLVRFSGMCMRLDSKRPVDIIPWDLGQLKKWWQALSTYCHTQAEPLTTLRNPEWQSKGLELVRSVYEYFKQQMSGGATGIMRVDDMKPSTRNIWDDFVTGRIDEEQAFIRLQIIQPGPSK